MWRARSTNTPSEPSPTTICRASVFRRRRSIWRFLRFRWACLRNCSSAGPTLPSRNGWPPQPMRKSASRSALFIRPSRSMRRAVFKAPIPARGSRGRVRCGPWARRPRSSCSMPGSATLSPMPRGTATKRRRTAIATPSFRPSRTWKISLRACAFWSRRRGCSRARWIRRGVPLIYRIRATRVASPAISKC